MDVRGPFILLGVRRPNPPHLFVSVGRVELKTMLGSGWMACEVIRLRRFTSERLAETAERVSWGSLAASVHWAKQPKDEKSEIKSVHLASSVLVHPSYYISLMTYRGATGHIHPQANLLSTLRPPVSTTESERVS